MKMEMTQKQLEELPLYHWIEGFHTGPWRFDIIRVPGGVIYLFDGRNNTGVFVPFERTAAPELMSAKMMVDAINESIKYPNIDTSNADMEEKEVERVRGWVVWLIGIIAGLVVGYFIFKA